MKEYRLASPSIDGLLAHDTIRYGGVKRPSKVMRLYDNPARVSFESCGNDNDRVELERYFADLYGVFMKKFSNFVIERDIYDEETVTLQAMLQEMIKVKKILSS